MDLKSGYPFWLMKNGVLCTYPSLQKDIRCDVAIIGGGITGALIAYHLTKAGFDTVVLDKRLIGWGSTCATTALLQYEIDTPLCDLIEMVGEDHAVRSYQACLAAIDKLAQVAQAVKMDCGFVAKKSLYVASYQKDVAALKREYAVRKRYGLPSDWLDQQAIEALFSFSRPAALLSTAGAQVDAYRFTHGLLQTAMESGLQVFTRTEVKTIDHTPRRVHLTTNDGYKVTAKNIVFASGYESQQYLKGPVAKLVSTYAVVSEPLAIESGWHEQCLIWESARPYVYLRTTEDGRAIIGGEDEEFRDPVRRDRLIRSKAQCLRKKFHAFFPHLPFEIAFSWAGTFGETKDGLAYIGSTPDLPHAYFALGYGGNGITYSLIAAEVIRDALLGQKNTDAALFRFDR